HPQVRLEAVRALSVVGGRRAAEMALRALDRQMDENLDYGLWLTLRELEPAWLPALQEGKFDFGGNIQRPAFALHAIGSRKVVGPRVALVRGGKLPAETEEGILTLLASVGGPDELALVLQRAIGEKKVDRQGRLLVALDESARQRNVLPAGDRKVVVDLLDAMDERVQTT